MVRLLLAINLGCFTYAVILALLYFYIKIKKGEILSGIIHIIVLLIIYLVIIKLVLLKMI